MFINFGNPSTPGISQDILIFLLYAEFGGLDSTEMDTFSGPVQCS